MKDGEPRNIINVSSTSGVHGNAGQINYAFAKAGVNGMAKAVAKEWGPQFGVRVNAVAFGYIQTRLTDAKEKGAHVTLPDGTKVALGIPSKQGDARAAGGEYPLNGSFYRTNKFFRLSRHTSWPTGYRNRGS